MEKLPGMLEAFKEARQVFLTTTDDEGNQNIRAMTNFNQSPYEPMWFASFRDTNKIKDISANSEVVVSFPAEEENMWFRIIGSAKLAPWEEVRDMWKWWYLEWVPEEKRQMFELQYDNPFIDRSVIWVKPIRTEIRNNK